MPKKLSAGILVTRRASTGVQEVLIVHPGGPFWARKDDGAWSLPKGEYEEGEDPREAAIREFGEELGLELPEGELFDLGVVKQPSGKLITAYGLVADLDLTDFKSNTFEMEWPPRSGKLGEYPEVDRAEWMQLSAARIKLLKGQVPILDQLVERLAANGSDVDEGTIAANDAEQESLF